MKRPLTFQKTIASLLKFCFNQGITFMQCANPSSPHCQCHSPMVASILTARTLLRDVWICKCNACISINSGTCVLECARILGSAVDFFPQVTGIRGTSIKVTNTWAFAIRSVTL